MRSIVHGAVFVLVVSVGVFAHAAPWYVRAGANGNGSLNNPFGTIQAAINAATSGDVMNVAQGTYAGNLAITAKSLIIRGGWNTSFDLRDRLKYVSTIDAKGAGSCLRYIDSDSGELSGFTVANGSAQGAPDDVKSCGGGIYCAYSSPIITNNSIVSNHAAAYGGGIFVYGGAPIISRNMIQRNGAAISDCGGGIYAFESQGDIIGNTIVENDGGMTGGGIYCGRCSSVIAGNLIARNSARVAAGIACYESSLTIGGNSILDSFVPGSGLGAGVHVLNSYASTIAGNVIAGSHTYGDGGGIYLESSSDVSVVNNTLVDNDARMGRAIACYNSDPSQYVSTTTISNCIMWDRSTATGTLVHVYGVATLTISYSDLKGGTAAVQGTSTSTIVWGPGIMNADPLFANPDADEYHLKSRYGRWDAAANGGAGAWVTDAVTSPCIDAGDPASDYTNEPRPNYGRINLGAYGNSPQASKSGWNIPGDADDNCAVNILDLILVRQKLNQDVTSGSNWKADLSGDGKINILDLINVRRYLNTRCR